MSNQILKGTALLTGAAFISKILGMIYVIPFNALVGAQGGALYYYAYNPYTILIGISTVGLPLAVSKIVSKYNSMGQYNTSLKTFKMSMTIMLITGITAFLILYFSAEWFASRFVTGDEHGNSIADVKQVIRMVSFALLIIPSMSVMRGFFQGNQRMEPTAVSQVIEQIVRIAFVLLSAFVIVQLYDGSIVLAVSLATFAAFIGALASWITLGVFWKKQNHTLNETVQPAEIQYDVSHKTLAIELFSYAGPFVLVGIAIPLYQMVDSFTFNSAMADNGLAKISETALSTINLYGHKLIIIPVSLATGLSLSIVPALTDSFTRQNRTKLLGEINQALQIILLLVIPSAVGLSALAYEAYGSLYGMEDIALTGSLLAWYAPIALFFALFTVTAAILQGINEQRFAVLSLLLGVILKFSLNTVLIHTLDAKGSILATAIASGAAVALNFWVIKRAIQFSFKQTLKRLLFMIVFSAVMGVAVLLTKYIFGFFLPFEENRIAATLMLMIGVVVGAVVYLFLAYKSTLLESVLGDTSILKRLKRKKRS